MSIIIKQIAKKILAGIISVVLISTIQGTIFGFLYEGNGGWWLRFSNDAPNALVFNVFSAIVYFVLFETSSSKIPMVVKAIVTALLCSGSFFVLATCFTYMGVATSVKFLIFMLCYVLGNMLYPFLKNRLRSLFKNETQAV